MHRALLCLLVVLAGCDMKKTTSSVEVSDASSAGLSTSPKAGDGTPSATASASASAPVKVTAHAPSASASASAKAGGACAALKWDKDKMNVDGTVTFEGKVDKGEGSNATNVMEKFQTLVLDKPACGNEGTPVTEVQLYTNDKGIALDKMVGKHVSIDGEAFAEQTAHHHRPIVVEVKKLTVK
jgi:hypothetical protein